MNITQEQFDEAVLTVFSGDDWEIIKQGLANEIYAEQAGVFNKKSWDDVVESKGFARGLQYVIGLREQTVSAIAIKEHNDADV